MSVDLPTPVIASSTMLSSWKRCRRQWWFWFYLGLVPRAPDPASKRATGSRVHRALAAHYQPADSMHLDARAALEEAIAQDREAVLATATQERAVTLLADLDKVADLERAMVAGYLEWLEETGVDSDLAVVAPETALSVDLEAPAAGGPVPVRVVGTLDVRGRRRSDGRRVFIDHKTTGTIDRTIRGLARSEQKLHYALLEWLTTPEGEARCDAALWNILRRVKRTERAKPPFYARHETPISEAELRSYQRRMLAAARDVAWATRALDEGRDHRDVTYPTPAPSCDWDCDFAAVCRMADDGSPGFTAVLDALYERVDPQARYERRDSVGVVEE